jgi:hypothetical protein
MHAEDDGVPAFLLRRFDVAWYAADALFIPSAVSAETAPRGHRRSRKAGKCGISMSAA